MPKQYTVLLLIFFPLLVYAQVLPNNWKLIGQAELNVLWFDIYQAQLLSSTGQYQGDSQPLLLKLNYQRDISKEELLRVTRKEIAKFASKEKADIWINNLDKIWLDIKEGDELSFWIDNAGVGHFFFKDRWIGSIAEPEFSQAFIQIWLSDRSSYPKLAKQLKGE